MRGWIARFRVTARMARRQARRTLASSVLVVLMVALPVGALAAGGVLMDSSFGTEAQKADVELGQNQGYVIIVNGPDPSLRQHPSDPTWTRIDWKGGDGPNEAPEPVNPVRPLLATPAAALPAGTKLLPVSEPRAIQVNTAGGTGAMTAIIGDVWEPSFAGRFDVVGGERPHGPGQIMATQAALDRLGAKLGDAVALTEPALRATVVGVIDFAAVPDSREILFLGWAHASAFGLGGEAYDPRWYLPDTALSWADVQQLNTQGVTAYSREVVLDPPLLDDGEIRSNGFWDRWGPVVMVIIAGAVFAAYQVMLLAGAAFAVSSRRQRQALATAASVGAAPAEVRRIVLLQGTVLGLVGGLLGLALGAAVAALFMQLADNGDRTQFWGYNVPWWALAVILLFAVAVGTLSALVPARGAAKAEVLAALRGARKPQQPSRKRPAWGSVLIFAGVGLTVAGALGALALVGVGPEQLSYDSPVRWLPWIALIAGPLFAQIGIILAGAWILHLISRPFSRIGLGARLASRDAAANAARSVPAFASIAAAVFISVFAVNMFGVSFASTARDHVQMAPIGYSFTYHITGTPEGRAAAIDMAVEALTREGARDVITVRVAEAWEPGDPPTPGLLPMASYPSSVLCGSMDQATWEECTRKFTHYNGEEIVVIEADDLATTLGTDLPAQTRRAYESGTVLTIEPLFIENGQIEIGQWDRATLWCGEADCATGPTVATQDRENAADWTALPAIAIDVPVDRFVVIVSPATAAALGFATVPSIVMAAFDEPLSTFAEDAINQVGQRVPDGYFWVQTERGPEQPWPWYLLTLGIAGILVLGASAVSIGLARFDGRADDATLAAVGGTRGIRRSISFWQAIVITGVGTLSGTLTALLASWGFVLANERLQLEDFPWPLIVGVAVGLPLLVAIGAWLISPRPAVLTRRTAIA